MKKQEMIENLHTLLALSHQTLEDTNIHFCCSDSNFSLCIDSGIQRIAKGAEIERTEYPEKGYTRLSVNIQGCQVSQLEVTDWDKFFETGAAV